MGRSLIDAVKFISSKSQSYNSIPTNEILIRAETGPTTNYTQKLSLIDCYDLPKKDSKGLNHEQEAAFSIHHEFKFINRIGIGSYGYVVYAQRIKDSRDVAIKLIEKRLIDPNELVCIRGKLKYPSEAYYLMMFDHPNIIKYIGLFEDSNTFYLVTEYPNIPASSASTDLFTFIENNPKIPDSLIINIFSQVLVAIKYIHGLGIVHGDVKDENILINCQHQIKIIDFGSSKKISNESENYRGTRLYAPPEVIRGESLLLYDHVKAEMWTLGILLHCLTFGRTPYTSFKEIIDSNLILNHDNKEIKTLLTGLLHKNPINRMSVDECLRIIY